jgi:predicted glycogen debranching enzyme
MTLVRRLTLASPTGDRPPDPHDDLILSREWLVSNGIGGYASGTVSGAITRRFHGALIASLSAPLGRVMMMNHLAERVDLTGGGTLELDAQPRSVEAGQGPGKATLIEFLMEDGLPVWRYDLGDERVLEKRLSMPHRQNTVLVTYTLTAGDGVHLQVEPWLHFRPHEGSLNLPLKEPYAVTETGDRYEITAGRDLPTLRLRVAGANASFFVKGRLVRGITYGIEASRGYDASGDLYAPGSFECDLRAGQRVTLTASTEPWNVVDAMSPDDVARCEAGRRARLLAWALPQLREGSSAELVLAADQFIVEPPGRVESKTVTYACGDEARSVIAGYHWFTDWGRDTMISLEGLTLVTGRFADARNILGTFARYARDGLIPNMFPEGNAAGLYHTADATLWFFHAIDRYLSYSRDRALLTNLLPTLVSIAEHHAGGTRFGIGVDSRDGLLRQGAPDLPLTWMDAKVGDLVVTPRRGKAVEINALYYNALRLLARWLGEEDGDAAAKPYVERAELLRASFNARFWCADAGYLYDVVDGEGGDSRAMRPNQLFAVALPNPVLDVERWPAVVSKCEERLVTPMGLRSLAEGEPDYKACYFGDLRSRDLAYHQGTVWAWLIGPFVDAWVKVHPGQIAKAQGFVRAFGTHLSEACVGSISEVFDAEAPYTARGCVAQAWSVAEVLRLSAVLREPSPTDGAAPG